MKNLRMKNVIHVMYEKVFCELKSYPIIMLYPQTIYLTYETHFYDSILMSHLINYL